LPPCANGGIISLTLALVGCKGKNVSLWGGLLKLGYRLQRHRIGPLALGYWPLLTGLLLAGIPCLLNLNRVPTWPYALALSVVGVALVSITLSARPAGYIRFEQDESLAAHLHPDVPPIEPDEKVSVRATGILEVRTERHYFVEAEANFATMETREHIVMARIPLSRMWLVARSSKDDAGWWYAFVNPAHIRSIQTGRLHHGLRPRPALKIEYQRRRLIEGKKKTKEIISDETIYLSVANPLTLHRLLENLVRDAGRQDKRQQYVPL